MAIGLEQVVKQLTDSGIVAAGKLENFVPPHAHPKNPEELLRELVKQNQLTKFQAQQVFAGKARSLILGNYTILDKIGAGGMGQVFKAEHRRMRRVVALKTLPPSVTKDPMALARFQREVEAAAKLSHSNIVAAHDADEAGGVHFLVMEYVEGSDLSALIKKDGPLAVDRAIDCVLQAARGLEFAHGEGVIHRDIKPANLLLDKRGTIKILDMGLARIESGGLAPTQAELTGTGAVMGTVDYMAPEQAMNTKHADARADVYSLGVTLWYLLTGQAMYGGETFIEKFMAHKEQPIPSLKATGVEVSDGIERVFRRMVAKNVDERYQSMSEVLAALQPFHVATSAAVDSASSNSNLAFLKSEPTQHAHTVHRTKAIRPSAASESPSKSKRVKLLAAASGGVAALLILAWIVRASLAPTTSNLPSTLAGEGSGVRGSATKNSSTRTSADGTRRVPATLPPLAVAPFDVQTARAHQQAWATHLGTQVHTKNSLGMKLTLIPPGEFQMGSTDEQVAAALKVADEIKADQGHKDRIRDVERPQHRVVITKPFLIGTMEVTVAQFRKFATAKNYKTEAEQVAERVATTGANAAPATPVLTYLNPGYAVNDELPATFITWNDAVAFCLWLSEQEKLEPPYEGVVGKSTTATGKGYHLPTEAQWEYACRAGTTTQYSFGDDPRELTTYAWIGGGSPRDVGTKPSNHFGLHDMHGNAFEWCQDWYEAKSYGQSPADDPKGPYSGSARVIRGGAWNYNASICRSAYRSYNVPSTRIYYHGFRCVRAW